jgi:hypothetical protein
MCEMPGRFCSAGAISTTERALAVPRPNHPEAQNDSHVSVSVLE